MGVEKWKGLYGLGFSCFTRFLILKCVFGLCEGREGTEQFDCKRVYVLLMRLKLQVSNLLV